MEGKLIIPIEADISQFKIAFGEATKIISDFNAQLNKSGASSNLFSDNSIGALLSRIGELEKKIEKLKTQFDALKVSSTQTFTETAKAADKVTTSANTASKSLGKTVDVAAKGKQTLTALSLVAQDLPFGFIAIQNNLPNLIQYFGELRKGSEGTRGAFKNLGAAMLGTGGVYFAFSVAVATVSQLVQKYGSLTLALKDLFGVQFTLIDLQGQLNNKTADTIGSTAGEVSNINSLVKIWGDYKTTQDGVIGVKKQLLDKYPGLLFSLKEENRLTDEGTQALARNAQLYAKRIELEGKKEGIISVINEATKEQLKTEGKLATMNWLDAAGLALKGVLQGYTGVTTATMSVANTFERTNSQINFFNQKLDETNTQLAPIIGQITELEKAAKKALEPPKKPLDFKFVTEESLIGINAVDNLIKKVSDYADIILDINKKTGDRVNAVNELKQVDAAYFKNLDLSGMKYSEINELITQYIHNLRVLELEQAGASSAAKLQQQAYENVAQAAEDRAKSEQKLFDQLVKQSEQEFVINQPKFSQFKKIELWSSLFTFDKKKSDKSNQELLAELNVLYQRLQTGLKNPLSFTNQEFDSIIKGINDVFKNLDKNMDTVQNKIESALRQPFEDFFNEIIENGRVSFDMFKNLAINALKQIAAKALSAGIAKLLTTILNPETSALKSGVKAGGSILELLGSILGTKPSAANLGGLQGGGMQLAGEVVFVQRGSELVGVLNRTNATINRVG